MKRKIYALVLVASMLLALGNTAAQQTALSQQDAVAQQGTKPLSNVDIVSMIKAGLSDNVIVGSIMMNSGNYDVSPSGLIALNKAGVSIRVLEAMIESSVPKNAAPPASTSLVAVGPAVTPGPASNVPASFVPAAYTAPAGFGQGAVSQFVANPSAQYPGQMPGQMPGVFPGMGMDPQPTVTLVTDGVNVPLQGERIQSIQTSSNAGSPGKMTGSNALNEMASAGATDVSNRMLNGTGMESIAAGINVFGGIFSRKAGATTYVWALRGKLSSNIAPVRLPAFQVSFADIPGVDPDEFEPQIVRVESTKNNLRLVGATKATDQSGQNGGALGVVYSSFIEQVIPTEKKLTTPGNMQIMPDKELPPGEYAVVLRPVSAKKKFTADVISRNDGEGLLFNSAWSFSVKQESKQSLVATK